MIISGEYRIRTGDLLPASKVTFVFKWFNMAYL